ncbi:hypothetical protein HRI_003765900 [Hibiscus trionum]|uniref:Uncharacterized protein n=1 Tax=Hibiscus trionum TaxID=183268 RepID=A0A9W7IRN2_HIBTR|nr:hypothetical protein HRI_003765900 [Hibiscus trionum]
MLSVSRTASLIHFLALGNSFMDLVVCCNGLRLYQFVGPGFIPPNYCLLPYGSRPALQQHPKIGVMMKGFDPVFCSSSV